MTPTQIEYFLAAAKCLNFTEAAHRLHITQPALSRQISAIESELNMQLFIRTRKTLRLTPAGAVLLEKLPTYQTLMTEILRSAQDANHGLTGSLKIGILDGHVTSGLFPGTCGYFDEHYPNIQLTLERHSFGGLTKGLSENRLDMIVTLSFDFENTNELLFETIEESRAYLAVPSSHPCAHGKNVSISDFKDDIFIVISPDDSPIGANLCLETFKSCGFYPRIKYAPSLQTLMLWVEAGLGVSILNSSNALFANPAIHFVELGELTSTSVVFAWKKENCNPTVPLFIDHFIMHNKQ